MPRFSSILKLTGVYCIEHLLSGKKYVGSTGVGFGVRWRCHRRSLNKGKHHSRYLQNAWNKYGSSAFEFRVLEITEAAHAVAVEQTFIDAWKCCDQEFGYNVSPTAGSTLGFKYTEEVKSKIAKTRLIPEVKARQKASAKEAQNRPEQKAKLSAFRKSLYESESERIKQSIAKSEYYKNHENRRKQSANKKAYYEKPGTREAQSASQLIAQRTESARKNHSEATKAFLARPGEIENHRKRKIELYADPERKAKWLLRSRMTKASKLLVIIQ